MYADRRHHSSAIDPRSLGIAVAINGAVVAALLFANPMLTVIKHNRSLQTYQVPIDPPPPPQPIPEPVRHPQTHTVTINAPKPIIDLQVPSDPVATTTIILPPPLPVATGTAVVPEVAPTPALVMIGPEIDAAHRGDLQPTYPAAELRAEREGVAVVRVLVGVDGRVRQVEQVSATNDAFFRATQDQAMRRWRFRPATRGGIPIEAWRQMTIRFVIPR